MIILSGSCTNYQFDYVNCGTYGTDDNNFFFCGQRYVGLEYWIGGVMQIHERSSGLMS